LCDAEAICGELLLRFGYQRVTIEDLATRAEVGKGTVGVLLNRYAEMWLVPGVPLEFYGRGIFAARKRPSIRRPT
jgi:hypothetical protein